MRKLRSFFCATVAFSSIALGTMITACGEQGGNKGEYTYSVATSALGTNWNPHTWEVNADEQILGYLTTPFVDISIKDTAKKEYQWVFEMADEIVDVTAQRREDITKYGSTLPLDENGQSIPLDEIDKGFVFEFRLNKDAEWENGDDIKADDYIYSMEQLLNPKMRNYRANLYVSGESAVAGGKAYYNAGVPTYRPLNAQDDVSAVTLYSTFQTDFQIGAYTIENAYERGLIKDDENSKNTPLAATHYRAFLEKKDKYGYFPVVREDREKFIQVIESYLNGFGDTLYTNGQSVDEQKLKKFFFVSQGVGQEYNYDGTVGCYKVDDYTFRYVTQNQIDYSYFLTACTSNWLVHRETYERGKDTSGAFITTNYGTSPKTTMSCGAYKMQSFQADKQAVFVQNDEWYGYDEEDGKLVSYTDFLVDGERVRQYETTRVVLNVMQPSSAKQAFLKGEISEWAPQADDLSAYKTSDRLLRADQTYTMSFFFNTNLNALKNMDVNKGNKNSVVLSNRNFRKAFSLAMDRKDYVSATSGWKPTYALMNDVYYYNVFSDPLSVYRNTSQAMQAICNLYGVEYGADQPYKTLEEGYKSVTGYNLTQAKALMKTAYNELVEEKIYTPGDEIKITIGWAKGELTADDKQQLSKMNAYINAAAEGSGFGKITLEAKGNIPDRYGDVPKGEYAIGYGAWGGAAFYPFRNFQVYFDPDEYDVNELGCYDPTREELTLTIDGKQVRMTWQQWSKSMLGGGAYANANFETKLQITAGLEEAFLGTYYRIPIAATTECTLLSYQADYFTHDYNVMYAYGGLRLMKYHYDDYEWKKYVKAEGGTISYA